MKVLLLLLVGITTLNCQQKAGNERLKKLNVLSEEYVRLGLYIGQYDPDFVDAYYGPDSLKPVVQKTGLFPKDSLLAVTSDIINKLKGIVAGDPHDTISSRANWISRQL